ncbi:hypothetical protein ACH4S8_38700 [Streptomyces sp. NPDC021080]|uniref:hypothetical protein n=1 Tax=Streptomyces sp. NPDC021080 TaxID=3365110 RepID=UPI00378FFE23
MSSVSVGRLLRHGACAGAVGALVVAGLGRGVAFADDPAQSDQLWIQVPYEQTVVVAPDGGAAPYRSLALGLYHSNDNFTVTDGRLTVDVSGLTGVAEVVWPDNCTPNGTGTVAVCDTGDVPTEYTAQVQLKVRATAGAAVGAQGAIEYSAEATGGPDGTLVSAANSFKTLVTVGSGPDLGLGAPRDVTGVAPGSRLTVPFSVTNTGNETAHGFSVQMWATYGLDVVTRYPQCTYTGPDDSGPYLPVTYVTCSFDTAVAPGATVRLPKPLRLAVTHHALYDRFDYAIEPDGGATDLDESDNSRSWRIDADNTADFAVRGAEASGAAGDTVTTAFRFVNHGPAWAAYSSGEPIAVIDFYLPEGTTATDVPDACFSAWTSGDDPAIGHYICGLPMWIEPGLKVRFPFRLHIDRVVPDATGHVIARPRYGGTSFPFDPNSRNNSAEVIVNPSA